MTPEIEKAISYCCTSITKGSKSFSLAARLFPQETREAAFCLYGWCRHCDDEIDALNSIDKIERLHQLKQKTLSCFTDAPQSEPVFVAFQYLVQKYAIPQHYPLELLEGMGMDVKGHTYETLDDLRLYCYRVAGTVGLMMSHVMGLSDERALENACDLGTAMQLTNIARDIREDFDMGRIYLPRLWMKESGLSEKNLLVDTHRPALVNLIKRLLSEADRFYRSGDEGLKFLSIPMALSIASARHVYAEIGRRVLRRGASAWDTRTIVPLGRKLLVMLRGIVQVLMSVPSRVGRSRVNVPIKKIWSFQ